jgi:serine phosphatase RsbU (regulator of sigma subunit)
MAVIADGTLRWANAGHGPPWLLRADGHEALKATGVPLGVQASARYEEHEAPFGPGDVLFASTDGLIEARRGGSFFGEQRLPALLAEHGRALGPRELVALIYREVEAWAPQLNDDVVILALRPQP